MYSYDKMMIIILGYECDEILFTFLKIYGLFGLKHHIVKKAGGQRGCWCRTSNNKQGTIDSATQIMVSWKTEFLNCSNVKDDI